MTTRYSPSAEQAGRPAANDETPASTYRARSLHFARLRDEANQARYRAANASVFLFLGTVLALLIGIFGTTMLLLVVPVSLVAFLFAFARQGRLDTLYRRYATLWNITEEGLLRLQRDWQALPLRQPPSTTSDSLYAADLDLLGHASLQHLLNSATTPAGQQRLEGWLLRPAAPATVRLRQAGVAELAPLLDFRDELTLFGRLSGMTQPEYAQFLAWAEQGLWLSERPWLLWLSRLLPLLTVAFLIAQFSGVLPYPIWLVFVVANLFMTQYGGKRAESILDQVSERQAVFLPYAEVLRRVAAQPFTAPVLREAQTELAASELEAGEEMRRLGQIMRFADVRLSAISAVLQAVLLWNFHALWLLERWQRRAGGLVRGWLETLSEIEALAALGALSFENPDWCFPEIVDLPAHETPSEAPALVARDLGHPLLPPALCVGNDVRVGPPGTFMLVTGSNMSGKSTLLRAVGVNVALAQAGGPVCARELRMPPIALTTSIRVQDSLEYGVSYFMAELRRLKQVIDVTEETQATGQQLPFFLLDEILHGTNTYERQIAARRIIRHLLALGATGIVSTHDLTLADAPEFARTSEQAHFTESFTRGPDGPAMHFDYKLRPGIATSTNALKLMELVGLPLDDGE